MVKKETSSSRDYVECPTCRDKCFRRLTEIPKSLVMMQLLEAAKSSTNLHNLQPNNNNNNNTTNNNYNNYSSSNYYPNFAAFHPLGTPHEPKENKSPPSYTQVTNDTSPPKYQAQSQLIYISFSKNLIHNPFVNQLVFKDGIIKAIWGKSSTKWTLTVTDQLQLKVNWSFMKHLWFIDRLVASLISKYVESAFEIKCSSFSVIMKDRDYFVSGIFK